MKKTITLVSLTALSLAATASAVIIGMDDFTYADGPLAGATGGTGFDWDNTTTTHTGTSSNWNDTVGAPSVTGGVLTTNASGVLREYNGPGEGSTVGSDEHLGALRGSGVVFITVDMNRSSTASSWSGVSAMDFGEERLFFGVRGLDAAADTVGLEISGGVSANTGISIADDSWSTIIAVLDFDNDLVGIWVNPDGADAWDGTGGTADATLAYTGTNWNSSTRIQSGAETSWDNFKVSTTFADAVPEPSSAALLGLGGLALILRRRKG